jgi:hypothetical protein
MRWLEKFSFLKESTAWHNYEVDYQEDQWVYKFKSPNYEGYRLLIGIPSHPGNNRGFWYKYFIKGNKTTYHANTPLEELPEEVCELVEKSLQLIEKQRRLRKALK